MSEAGEERVVAACGRCGAEWPVPARYAGRTVTCRRCHAQVAVPFPTEAVPVDPVAGPPSSGGRTAEQIILPVRPPPAVADTAPEEAAAAETEPLLPALPARRRWPLALAGLVLLLVAGGAGLLWWVRR